MNSFWVKIAVFAVIVVGLIVLVKKFSTSNSEPKPKSKTVYEVWEEDEKRLRAEPEVEKPPPEQPEPDPIEQTTPTVAQKPEPQRQVRLAPRQFKELEEIEKIDAEKLFEVALQHRKMGRLPVAGGLGYKTMVDCCRQIIKKYPGSVYAYKARRMLAEVPQRLRGRYKITDEEINLER